MSSIAPSNTLNSNNGPTPDGANGVADSSNILSGPNSSPGNTAKPAGVNSTGGISKIIQTLKTLTLFLVKTAKDNVEVAVFTTIAVICLIIMIILATVIGQSTALDTRSLVNYKITNAYFTRDDKYNYPELSIFQLRAEQYDASTNDPSTNKAESVKQYLFSDVYAYANNFRNYNTIYKLNAHHLSVPTLAAPTTFSNISLLICLILFTMVVVYQLVKVGNDDTKLQQYSRSYRPQDMQMFFNICGGAFALFLLTFSDFNTFFSTP